SSFFFSSRRRHTRSKRDWSSDVCSSDLDQKSRHGVVLAKSPAAKRYGIRTGEPVANAFRKCPNLAMFPPNHKMYREKSRLLMEYLRTFTKELEQVSGDECYMDFPSIGDRYHSHIN